MSHTRDLDVFIAPPPAGRHFMRIGRRGSRQAARPFARHRTARQNARNSAEFVSVMHETAVSWLSYGA
jgi:hypothetical protein